MGIFDRLQDTARQTGDGLADFGAGVVEGDTNKALVGLGKATYGLGTGGRAYEYRQNLQSSRSEKEQEMAAETGENLENSEGFFDELGAVNDALKVGLDNTLDNPTDEYASVQDTTTDAAVSASGAENTADLADSAEDLHAGYEGLQEPLGETYKSTVDTAFEAAGADDLELTETVAKEAPGTAAEWFVEQPAEATVTAATGIDPESGETDAYAEPIDLIDVATIGGGKALKGASKIGKAAKGGTMVKGLDELANIGRKFSDELGRVGRGGDDAAATNPGQGALNDEPISFPKRTESTPQVGDITDDAITIGTADDITTSATDDITGSFDDTLQSAQDTFNVDAVPSAVDDLASVGDNAASGVNDGTNLLSGVDDTVETATGGVDDFTSGLDDSISSTVEDVSYLPDGVGGRLDDLAAGDGVLNRAWRPFNNGINRVFGSSVRATDNGITASDDILSGADDVAAGADDTASAGDDIAAGADDAGSSAGNALGRLTGGFSRATRGLTSGIGMYGKLLGGGIAAALTGAFVADKLGFELDDADTNGTVETDNGTYKTGSVKTYSKTGAVLVQVYRNADGSWASEGYAVVHGKDPDGRILSEGDLIVVSESGEPVQAQPIAKTGEATIYRPRFGSQDAADAAHAAYVRWLKNNGVMEGSGGSGSDDSNVPPQSERLSGKLDTPSTVGLGESFTANWTVNSGGSTDSISSRLILGLQTPEGLGSLAEARFSTSPNDPKESGTFEIPAGWGGIQTGTHSVYAIATSGEQQSVVAESEIEVVEDGSMPDRTSDTDSDKWGDPEIVRELPYGWYLMAQPRVDGREEIRFLVVGKRDDGTTIYVHEDGSAETNAKTYPTAEEAAAAFQKWVGRHENGNTRAEEQPSEEAERPSRSEVAQDASKTGSGAGSRLGDTVQKATKQASENPVRTAAILAVLAGGGYYLYEKGYFDEIINSVKGMIPQ